MSPSGSGEAVPSASRHQVLNAPDAAVATAILAFVHTLEANVGSVNSRDRQRELARYAAAALDAAEGGPAQAALERALEDCGWVGCCFADQPDSFRIGARLKCLLYRGLKQQGEGTYSTVFRGSSLLTGGGVALKYMKLERRDLRQGFPAFALREISLLRQLSGCPHIVQLQDVLWDRRSLYLVMEQLSCDLKEHLDSNPAAWQLPAVKSAMYQALKGVAHAHAHRIIHRDIKPQNLLLDRRTGAVKVADFGLARNATPPLRPFTHEVVTLLYRAPEILLGSPCYGPPVDVWALGCVLAELSTGRPLFLGDSEISQLLAIFRVLGTPTEAAWPGVSKLRDWNHCFPTWQPRDLAEVLPMLDPAGLDLLRAMLRYDPASRIRCRQALAHPWFDDVRDAEEARGAAVMEAVLRARGEQRMHMEAAAAAYRHLQVPDQEDPEGPITPAEKEAATVGATSSGLASGQGRVLPFSSP